MKPFDACFTSFLGGACTIAGLGLTKRVSADTIGTSLGEGITIVGIVLSWAGISMTWFVFLGLLKHDDTVLAALGNADRALAHPAANTFCYVCGKRKGVEPCDQVLHSCWVTTGATPDPPGLYPGGFCHICGAKYGPPCDDGLHG